MICVAGIPLVSGLALGRLTFGGSKAILPRRSLDSDADVEKELLALDAGYRQFESQLLDQEDRLRAAFGKEEAELVEGFREIVFDEETLAEVRRVIREDRVDAANTLLEAGESHAVEFDLLDDLYLRERASDVRSLFRQFALVVSGIVNRKSYNNESSNDTETRIEKRPGTRSGDCAGVGSILYCDEITALDLLSFPEGELAGIVTASTTTTSHGAILARGMGLPTVGGVPIGKTEITRGSKQKTLHAIVDGSKGTLVIDPDNKVIEEARIALEKKRVLDGELEKFRHASVIGVDNRPVRFAANIGLAVQAKEASRQGADGVGLMRTEFLFMGGNSFTTPSEQSQEALYRSVLEVMAPRPVKIRTLDAGGDKPIAGLTKDAESNPFLGLRSIRLSLSEQHVFRTQLRALLRASQYGNLQIMFPMITKIQELRAAKEIVKEVRQELRNNGVPVASDIPIGIMVETPAAALTAAELAAESDFFSVGTNDLTQYVLAVDRGNDHVAALYDPSHSAVIRLLEEVADAARRANIPASVCGEAAADPPYARRLINMGYTELSMDPASILFVKAHILSSRKSERKTEAPWKKIDS